ncbi:MAG TPA: chemotaxis protein CheA [Thermoanaerobacterales bacterium]|nr:chemotaxis protein CheA [Thermoanaerobacterales bacterium]
MNEQYLNVFLEEAKEHILSLNQDLLELEASPEGYVVDEIFRSAHTLKGMSGTMGFNKISQITHEMENLLQEIRSGNMTITPEIIDTLLEATDVLESFVNTIAETGEEGKQDIKSILNKLKRSDLTYISNEQNDTQLQEHHGFNEYEGRLINQALEKQLYVWKIIIKLQKECLLKSARAFLVFKTLENFGDIIKTEPPVQDIEDEKFDSEFTLFIVTSENRENIKVALESISELESIVIEPVNKVEGDEKKQINRETKTDDNSSNSQHFNKTMKMTKTIRVDINRLDKLMNLVSELIIIKTRLEGLNQDSDIQKKREALEYLERITSSLHDAVMKVRMVPIENVFNRFPRVVHDLSRDLSKDISLTIEGAETELDRTIIDEIGDPLIHLIRNAADHGIESPEERIQNGKPEKGNIKLKAYHDGNNVVIEVGDDGKGIDVEKIKEKALQNGLLDQSKQTNLKQSELLSFLFEPGFSTKGQVTGVSGRGVGLDVVKTKIESLGGNIEIKTAKNVGTTFTIKLPLTLAIIQALMVMVGDEKYAIPLDAIKETVIISVSDIKKVQHNEVILLRGNVIPIVRLYNVLDIEKTSSDLESLTLVIVRKGDRDVGLAVDNLIGQQEIVIKSLGDYLKNIKFIAGATILGDGKVALILDTNALI